MVFSAALSADGHLLASAGGDGTVRLWETSTGRVALAADGHLAASGGFDGTVKLWEAKSGACLHTLQPERRYERMDVTGLTGVTDAQRTALLALGAVERHDPAGEPTASMPLVSVR